MQSRLEWALASLTEEQPEEEEVERGPRGCGGDSYQQSQHLQADRGSKQVCAWCPTMQLPYQATSGAVEPSFCTLSAILHAVGNTGTL